jgi:hypothetical protein
LREEGREPRVPRLEREEDLAREPLPHGAPERERRREGRAVLQRAGLDAEQPLEKVGEPDEKKAASYVAAILEAGFAERY